MSSILEALKKLEAESIEKDKSPFSWPQSVNEKGLLNQRLETSVVKRIFSFKTALILFCSAILIFIVIVFTPDLYREKTDPVPTGCLKKTEMNFSNNKQNKANRLIIPDPGTGGKKNDAPATTNIIVEKTNQGVNTFLAAAPYKTPSLPLKKTDIPKKIKERKIGNKEGQAPFVKPDMKNKPVKKVDSKWLKLHAISWSDIPGRRMAVINSMIVREGKKIEGARVVRIEKKSVVIEKDGESLLLSFDQY